MSKPEKEKVIVDCAANDLLGDLNVPELIRTFHKHWEKERAADAEAAKHKKDKDKVGENLIAAIDAVQADTVTYTGRKYIYRTTVIRGEPGEKLDEDKLRENLMKIGKLDAEILSRIWKLSQTPTDPRKSYIRLTPEPRAEQKEA